MKKLSNFSALVVALAMILSVSLVGCSKASLKEWTAPSYEDVTVGSTVPVLTPYVTDSNGKSYDVDVKVIGPKGEITVNGSSFVAADEGTYTVFYTVTFNGKDIQEYVRFRATASGGQGGGSQGGGSQGGGSQGGGSSGESAKVLGALKVIPGSESYFDVSGNTVTIKQLCDVSSWKSVGWDLVGWSLENGKNIRISVTNNTTGTVDVKYKAIVDGEERFGHPDLSIAAGETEVYSQLTGTLNVPAPSSVTSIELFIGAEQKGTITVNAELIGTGSGSGSLQVSAPRLTYDDADHKACFDISGSTITVKKAIAETDYKSVTFDVTGWSVAYSNFSYSVTSGISAGVKVVCKIHTNGTKTVQGEVGIGYAYPDVTISGAGTGSISPISAINDQPDATNVTAIEFFIVTNGTGTVTITPSYS